MLIIKFIFMDQSTYVKYNFQFSIILILYYEIQFCKNILNSISEYIFCKVYEYGKMCYSNFSNDTDIVYII
jgi:hypothetical protein